MKVLITGGTGFIGSALTRELRDSGHDVTITTRKKSDSKDRLTWNPPDLIPSEIITEFDAVINLAGESIFSGRWTDDKKNRIKYSRTSTTHALVESFKQSGQRPKVLINASAAGYYGPHEDEIISEETPSGNDFLSSVAKEWEAEAYNAEKLDIRVVTTRFGVVLESDGGALAQMKIAFKSFLGGHLGGGEQWFPWIHRDDLIGIIRFILQNKEVSGPVNVVAPQQITNREFSSALGKSLNRPSLLPVPGFMLKLVLGEFGEVLLTGQRVSSEKIIKAGYKFRYPEIDKALTAIFKK